jgi:hypothetical protein
MALNGPGIELEPRGERANLARRVIIKISLLTRYSASQLAIFLSE